MLLKIQFSANKLAEMLVARLKAQDLCFDPIDDHTFVDHIEFPATAKIHGGPDRTVWIPVTEHGTTRDATGPTVQVVIPLTIFKAGLADVRAAAPNPPPTEPIGGLEAVLGLDISTDASWLIVTFVKLQIVGGATTPQLDSLNAQLVKKVGRQLVPFIDVQGSLRAMGSQGQTVVWAGIATNRAESIVEVRLEYQTMRWTGDMLDWASFYAGDFFDLVGTDDWAFFLDRNLIVDSVGRIFSAALATDPSHFAPRSPVHVTWYVDPVNPEVEIFVVFSGLAISACNCFFTDIDVSVDVKATITFGVSADELTLDITFDYSSDPLAAFCCELSAGLFFPFVGTKYLLSGKLDEADYILGMIGWVLGAMVPDTIGAIIAESSRKAPIPSPGGPCTKASDSLITCSYPLPPDEAGDSCNEWLPTKRTATAVRGDDHGVVVAGSVDVAQVEPATLSVAVSPFEWGGLDVNCSGAVGTLTQTAFITLSDPAWSNLRPYAYLYFCDAKVIDHPEFDAGLSESFSYCPLVTTVNLSLPADQKLPAPVEVLVRTSAGVRVARIDPPAAPFDSAGFERAAREWRRTHCFTEPDPWWRAFQVYYPPWSVDPGPEGVEQQHVWEVLVGGLPAGTLVALVGENGRTLMQRAANIGGTALLWAGVTPGGTKELGVVRVRPQDAGVDADATAAASEARPRMQVRQFQLARIGETRLRTPASLISVSWAGGAPSFSVLTATALETYSAAHPAHPLLIDRLPVEEGTTGAAMTATGVITWGARGLRLVEPRDTEHAIVTALHPSAVESAAATFSHVYALTKGRLLVYGPRSERAPASERTEGRQLTIVGELLACTSEQRVELFSLARPDRPQLVGTIDADATGGADRPPVGAGGELRVIDAAGTSSFFDVGNPTRPRHVGFSAGTSWLDQALRVNNLVITTDQDRHTVTVASVISSRTL